MNINRKILIDLFSIAMLGFAVYANSLNCKFVWDDEWLIETNLSIRNLSNIGKIFIDIEKGVGGRYFYRPIQMVTYTIDYFFWGLKEIGYHLTNIILHILVTFCIFWLVEILFKDKLLSALTGIFFITHPVHTEAVTYISGRADILFSLFILLCFIFYINPVRYPSHKKQRLIKLLISNGVMLFSFLLAIFSRESSVILLLLLLFYHYSFKKKIKIKQFLPILAIAFLYLLIRLTILKSLIPHVTTPSTLFQRIPGFFIAIFNYIRLLILPFDLHMEYGNRLFSIFEPKAILGALILIGLIICAFSIKKKNNLVFFSIGWFFIMLLPQSNLFPINAYMAEHWLYLPSIGFFLILSKGLSCLFRKRNYKIFAIISAIILLVVFSTLTIRQNTYWKDPIPFYERTLKFAPYSAIVHHNLGVLHSKEGRRDEAIELFKKAIEISPDYAEAHCDLGNALFYSGKIKEAEVSFKKTIEIDPTYAQAYNNLGTIYGNSGRKEEAKKFFEKAIEVDPKNAIAHFNLKQIYLYEKNYNNER